MTRKRICPELNKELLYKEWVTNRLSQREIAEKYNVTLSLVETRIKSEGLIGVRSKIKYVVNTEHINLQSPVFWYLVGLTISDGHIDEKNKRVTIQLTDDYEILKTLSDFYSTEVPIPVFQYKCKAGKTRHVLSISSEELLEALHSINIFGNDKTSTVIMPDPNSKYLFNFLLRGYIDGDGNIRYTKSTKKITFRFYSHSINFINDFTKLFEKYYYTKVTNIPVKNKTGRVIEVQTMPVNTLINIYSDIPELSIRRKRNIVKEEVDDIVHRYGMINLSNW